MVTQLMGNYTKIKRHRYDGFFRWLSKISMKTLKRLLSTVQLNDTVNGSVLNTPPLGKRCYA